MLNSHLIATSLAISLLLTSGCDALVPSKRTPPKPRDSIELLRRVPTTKSYEEWGQWARNNRVSLLAKYGGSPQNEKRSTGTNLMVNQAADSSFYGSLAVGTPPVSYDVILDTGSADLWLAGPSFCDSSDCDRIATFASTQSSTLKESNTPFSITYGSGFASGNLATDTVQMAGFSVPNQVFGICNNVSSGMLTQPVSGLLGLAFETIASSKATPFWETLVKSGTWDSPLMAFQLTRYSNASRVRELEPGGSFTMGFVNSTLYTGEIDYQNIPSGQETYWIQQMTSLTIQGNSITLPSADSLAAIDTGTTLIGGPPSVVQSIYSQIEGSRPGTGDYEGYFLYPCSTNADVTIAFGGKSWTISNADFQVTSVGNSMCLGAFFGLETGNNLPSWIVGDAFLKNVYSVFRYDPPSVGFAELSAYSLSLNGANNPVPTPTIGSAAATVSATNLVKNDNNSAVSLPPVGGAMVMFVSMITVVVAPLLL
ncbi:hypothetical protein PM082_010310 [Marasmius tenuissimus]|nr:hypothetical protein PM082_010310 [Marasmius tenuissimus]